MRKKLIISFFRIIFIWSVISFIGTQASAQNTKVIDDLISALNKPEQPDSTKVNTLVKLALSYYGINPTKMLAYTQQAVELSKKANYKKGLADSYRFQGIAQYTMGNFK